MLAVAVAAHVLVGLPPTASVARANIFGDDDRRPLTSADGLDAVGLIKCDGSSRLPTASLITVPGMPAERDFDIVISVAHAFFFRDGRALTSCAFWPRGRRTDAVAITFVMPGTFTPGRNGYRDDWVVGVLNTRLSPAITPLKPMEIQQTEIRALREAGARFSLVGHNGENPRLLVSENCGPMPKRPIDYNAFIMSEFNHDCDMMPGWSGGPMIMELAGERFIVAVNSTEVHGLHHQDGDPYDGKFSPNTAIRISGKFLDTIHEVATSRENAETADAFCVAPAETYAC